MLKLSMPGMASNRRFSGLMKHIKMNYTQGLTRSMKQNEKPRKYFSSVKNTRTGPC